MPDSFEASLDRRRFIVLAVAFGVDLPLMAHSPQLMAGSPQRASRWTSQPLSACKEATPRARSAPIRYLTITLSSYSYPEQQPISAGKPRRYKRGLCAPLPRAYPGKRSVSWGNRPVQARRNTEVWLRGAGFVTCGCRGGGEEERGGCAGNCTGGGTGCPWPSRLA